MLFYNANALSVLPCKVLRALGLGRKFATPAGKNLASRAVGETKHTSAIVKLRVGKTPGSVALDAKTITVDEGSLRALGADFRDKFRTVKCGAVLAFWPTSSDTIVTVLNSSFAMCLTMGGASFPSQRGDLSQVGWVWLIHWYAQGILAAIQ